jgi:hypothetical protein
MDESQPSTPSDFLAAINRLSAQPAKVLREDTHLRLPVTMKIGDAYRCAYLARNTSSFQYLRDEDTFKTSLILRTVNEAWKHDKLPALAVCASENSAKALQKSAQIESVTAERFFSDLELARPVTQTFSGKKNYVIGHDHNPDGRFDKIVLPTFANIVVYEADKFSPHQLTSLCDHVGEVRGRVILCADWKALDRAQPEIGEILNDFFGYEGPQIPFGTDTEKAWELGNELEPHTAVDKRVPHSADSRPWVTVANRWWDFGANSVRSIHSSQEEALNAVPAVFAEEWRNYMFLCRGDWTDREPPSVSAAEWRATLVPEIGQYVRIENHAVVSVSSLDELPPLTLPDALRPDTRETDPLAKTRPFLVFHAKSDESTLFPDDYTLVARVEADNIDHALFLSQQHAEVSWTQYPGVTPFADKPRSTQVGDIIIDHDVPKRYVGPDEWFPATTTMDPAYVHRIAAEVNSYFSSPEPEQQIPPQTLKI